MSRARNLADLLQGGTTVPTAKVPTLNATHMPNGSWIMIHSIASGVETGQIVFDNNYITTAYDDYVVIGKEFTPTVDGDEAIIRVSSNNSAGNLVTCGSGRHYLRIAANPASGNEASTLSEGIQIATDVESDVGKALYFSARFYGLNNSIIKYMDFNCTGKHVSDEYAWRGGSSINTTSAVNWLAFKFNAGNVRAGARVALYGIKGSNHS